MSLGRVSAEVWAARPALADSEDMIYRREAETGRRANIDLLCQVFLVNPMDTSPIQG